MSALTLAFASLAVDVPNPPLAPAECTAVKVKFPDFGDGGAALRATLNLKAALRAYAAGVPVPRVQSRATPVTGLANGTSCADIAVGIALTGGSDSGFVEEVCMLQALDDITDNAFGANQNGCIVVAGVSSGSLAYASYASFDMASPVLKDTMTATDLKEFPAVDPETGSPTAPPVTKTQFVTEIMSRALVDVPPFIALEGKTSLYSLILGCVTQPFVCGILTQVSTETLDEVAKELKTKIGTPIYADGTTLREALQSLVECFFIDNPIACFLGGGLFLSGTPIEGFVPGNKPWWAQMSLVDYNAGPYYGTTPQGTVPAFPIEGLEDKLAYAAYEHVPGRKFGAEARLVAGAAFKARVAMRTVGASTRSNGYNGTGFLEDVHNKGGESKQVEPLDLWHALAFSADFTAMSASFVDASSAGLGGLGPQTCRGDFEGPLPDTREACAQRAIARDLIAADSSLLGAFGESGSETARVTDGGLADISGVVSLLKTGVKNVVLFYALNQPWETTPAISYLWGDITPPSQSPDLCTDFFAALGRANMQVFPTELFLDVYYALNDATGPGFVRQENVPVLENKFYGIKGNWTLDNLIIFGNKKIESFEGLFGQDYDEAAQGFSAGFPDSLPFGTTTSYDGAGKCILAKHKVHNAKEELLSILDPLL